MFSDQDNTSDSLDVTVTDVPESLLDYVISNFVKSLNEAKTAKKISAKIHHVEGQSPNLVLTLGGQSAIQPIEASRGTDNKRTKTILVRNVPASADEELLEMFFEQTKKQGGGPVNSVKILRDKNIAFVEFREYGAVETVMKKRNIKFGTTELQVEPYKPLLQGSEKINRMDISGLPVAFTDGLLKAQLDSLLSPQARLSAPPTESERKSKSKTTAVEIPTAGPFCQIPDYYGDGFGNKIKVGSRVIRGRNWHAHHGDYDGRGEGTVLQLYQLGSVKVRWDNGNEARYCLSFLLPERYDVKLSKP